MPFIRVNYSQGALSAEQKAQLAPRLVHALIRQETEFDPYAISPAGARGLMQMMPASARILRAKKPIPGVGSGPVS